MVFPFVFAPLSPVYSLNNREKYNIKGYMAEWAHYTMNSEQAQKYAREFLLRVNNIYPHYGIEEFLLVEISKLKKIAQLRFKVRKDELLKNLKIIDQHWQELKEIVCREMNI